VNLADYNTCVDLHADGVFRFVAKHIKDRDAAKDIVQDSFEKCGGRLIPLTLQNQKLIYYHGLPYAG